MHGPQYLAREPVQWLALFLPTPPAGWEMRFTFYSTDGMRLVASLGHVYWADTVCPKLLLGLDLGLWLRRGHWLIYIGWLRCGKATACPLRLSREQQRVRHNTHRGVGVMFLLVPTCSRHYGPSKQNFGQKRGNSRLKVAGGQWMSTCWPACWDGKEWSMQMEGPLPGGSS